MTLTPKSPLALAAALLLAAAAAPTLAADTTQAKIALSNNFAGNSWRQAMLKSWDKVTKEAVAKGVVAAAPSFTTAENQATEQAAQIQNMILQGFNAIVVNAASPTALNGAVKQACDAGIVVVSFDGVVTEPCAYRTTLIGSRISLGTLTPASTCCATQNAKVDEPGAMEADMVL